MKRLLILLLFAFPCSAQTTNTFCASNLPCNATGTWSFTQLSGSQHVNANQTFAAALAAVGTSGTIVIDPGTYTVSANATIPSGVTLVSNGGGAILSIATAVTLTINGPIFAPPGQLFAYVGTGTAAVAQGYVEATWFPGANLGVQVNNAALALSSAKAGGNTHGAGKIHIAAGTYSVPLGVMNPQADVILSCDENQATAITFTGASGIALLLNVGTAGGTYYEWGHGIENCQIYGPGWPSGSGQAGTGIQIGDSTHATIGVKITNSFIAGFAQGIGWGNPSAWGGKLDHTVFTLNTQDMVYNPNNAGGTENLDLEHVVFAPSYSAVVANDVVIGNGNTPTDITFNNCSFDNGQLVVSNTSRVSLYKPHFEYNQNTTQPFAVLSNSAQVAMFGPVVQYDPASGSVPTSVFSVSGATLDIYSPTFQSNVSIPNYLNASNSVTRTWNIQQLTNVGGPTYSAGMHIECGTIAQTCNFAFGGAGQFNVVAPGGINLENNTNFQGGNLGNSNLIWFGVAAPTISSGFGTSPSITFQNGSTTLRLNVGTGGTASSGVIAMNTTASNNWNCSAYNLTAHAGNRADDTVVTTTSSTLVTVQNQTKSTGAAVAWTASDVVVVSCGGE